MQVKNLLKINIYVTQDSWNPDPAAALFGVSKVFRTTDDDEMADKRPAEDDKNGHEGNGDAPDTKKAKPVRI